MTVDIICADARDALAAMPEGSVDAVVTDPPYGLEFMGKEWDKLAVPKAGNIGGFADGNKPSFERVRRHLPAMQAWHHAWAVEALRVLKPGGHLLAFGGTRTHHRLMCALEDAGFEIRDTLCWLYGSGFPKSLNIGKNPLFCQCASRNAEPSYSDGRTSPLPDGGPRTNRIHACDAEATRCGNDGCDRSATQPAPDSQGDCQERYRSGGELSPGVEVGGSSEQPSPIDAQKHIRSGAPYSQIQVGSERSGGRPAHKNRPAKRDSSRPASLPPDAGDVPDSTSSSRSNDSTESACCLACGKPIKHGWGTALKPAWEPIVLARKPLIGTVAANVLAHGTGALNVDGCRLEMREARVLNRGATTGKGMGYHGASPQSVIDGGMGRWPANLVFDEDAARLLDAQSGDLKSGMMEPGQRRVASKGKGGYHDRFPDEATATGTYGDSGGASRFFYCAKASREERGNGNKHPTVKPVDLMRWLVRLVTPPGGLILDPFIGSGTTAVAAILEGFRCIGIDNNMEYLAIAQKRIERAILERDSGGQAQADEIEAGQGVLL